MWPIMICASVFTSPGDTADIIRKEDLNLQDGVFIHNTVYI